MYTERKSPGVNGSDYSNRNLRPDEQLNGPGMRSLKINPGPYLYPCRLTVLVGKEVEVTGSCEGLVNSSKHRRRLAVALHLQLSSGSQHSRTTGGCWETVSEFRVETRWILKVSHPPPLLSEGTQPTGEKMTKAESSVRKVPLHLSCRGQPPTSVSSVFSSSKVLFFEAGDNVDSMDVLAAGEPERCRPAFSRSSSVHCNIEDSKVSISNRFASPLGVLRNCRRTFVTSLRSTLVLFDVLRSRRSASTRCSFMMTALGMVRDRIWILVTETYPHVSAYRSGGSSLSAPFPNPGFWKKWIGSPPVAAVRD